MSFIIKKEVQSLLDNVIKDEGAEMRQRKIMELNSILKFISFIEENGLEFNGLKAIHCLPNSKTGYSEFRILDDVDSDDPSQWIELKEMRISQGDLVIEMKV